MCCSPSAPATRPACRMLPWALRACSNSKGDAAARSEWAGPKGCTRCIGCMRSSWAGAALIMVGARSIMMRSLTMTAWHGGYGGYGRGLGTRHARLPRQVPSSPSATAVTRPTATSGKALDRQIAYRRSAGSGQAREEQSHTGKQDQDMCFGCRASSCWSWRRSWIPLPSHSFIAHPSPIPHHPRPPTPPIRTRYSLRQRACARLCHPSTSRLVLALVSRNGLVALAAHAALPAARLLCSR